MFDGLKEKLNSFTEDVDEATETDASTDDTEPGSDDGPSPEPEPAAGTDAGTEGAVTAESATSPGRTEAEATSSGTDADSQRGDSPSGESRGGQTNDSETTESAETSDSEGSETKPGLGERAKLFATGKTVIEKADLEEHLEELEFALLESDVELSVAEEIIDGVEANLIGSARRRLKDTGSVARDALREALYDVISVGQFDFEGRINAADAPVVIVFTGVNGVGKTTTIAKLAHRLETQGLSTVLANGDTFRAGANEQLEEHAAALDKKLITHEQGSDPTAVIYDAVEYAKANDVDVVLGDTAGRLHTSDGLMDQLEKIDRVIDPDMVLFVDEAVAGQDAVYRAREFNDAAEIDGTVLTKADADPQGGAAISIAHVTGKPILFLGTGQDYDDLEEFDPERVVDRLVGR